MSDNRELAERFVTRWVDKHVKTRILDGRPNKVFIGAMVNDLEDFLNYVDTQRKPTRGVAVEDECGDIKINPVQPSAVQSAPAAPRKAKKKASA